MKKRKIGFIACSFLALVLIACGAPETSATEAESPAVTEALQQTEQNEQSQPAKAPVGDITYTFKDLEWVASYGVEYSVKEDGSIDLQFEDQWQEIKLKFPKEIDMMYCTSVTVNAKSEYGYIAFKLFGEEFLEDPFKPEKYIYTECKGAGSKEYNMVPETVDTLYGLGIMALEIPENAADYTATVYSITFHMKDSVADQALAPTENGDVIYALSTAKVLSTKNASCREAEEGGLNLQFDGQWEMVRLQLPKGVDLSKCMYISVRMNTYGNDIYFDFFDEKILKNKYADGVDVQYSCYQDGIKEYIHVPTSGKIVYAIGFGAGGEVRDPESYVATVYSVTFHMLSGNKVEVPFDVAPNVTKNLNLLNTYGELFGKVGTSVSLSELESPAYLEAIKSQFNSVTSGWEAKMDHVIERNPNLISVAEAKRLGYSIPDNYKEAVVPKFNFDVLDRTLKACADNGLFYRVHALIWHQQALDWFFRTDYAYGADFVSPEMMDARMEMYIRTVMEHVCAGPYADVVYAWDVVNEYLHFGDAGVENYTAVYGPVNLKPEFVKLAFTVADDVLKKYGLEDQISLFYNDYNTYGYEAGGREISEEILSLMEFVNSDGKVCDGVGMQTHLMLEHYPDWRERFSKALQAFLDAGLEVQLTEIGVSENAMEITQEQRTEAYLQLMRDVLEIKKAGGNISSITFWEMADIDVPAKPYLFDKPGRPKEVYYRVLQTYREVMLGLPPVVVSRPDPGSVVISDWKLAQSFTAEELKQYAGKDVTLSIDYNTKVTSTGISVIQLLDLSDLTPLQAEDIVIGIEPDAESGNIPAEGGKTKMSLTIAKETVERLIANGGDENGAVLGINVSGVIMKEASLSVIKQDRIIMDASYPEANEYGAVLSTIIPAEKLKKYNGAVAITLSYVRTESPNWPWYVTNTINWTELLPKGNTSIQVDKGTMTMVLEKEDVDRAVKDGGIFFLLSEVYFTQAIIRDAVPEDSYVGDYNVAHTFESDEIKYSKGDVTFTMEYEVLPGYKWPTFQLTEITDTRWLDLDRYDYVDGSNVDDYECIYADPNESRITMEIKENVMQDIVSAGNDLAVRVVGIIPTEVSLTVGGKTIMVPRPTEAPEPTDEPAEDMPWVPEPAPKPTAAPTPMPTIAPNENKELVFDFNDVRPIFENNVSYDISDDGVLKVQFTAQYGGVKFVLPQGVDLADCESVTVKMKCEYNYVAPQLCEADVLEDPWLPEKYITFGCLDSGVKEYELYQEGDGVIWAIGFMGTEEAEDFSKYVIEAYNFTFRLK